MDNLVGTKEVHKLQQWLLDEEASRGKWKWNEFRNPKMYGYNYISGYPNLDSDLNFEQYTDSLNLDAIEQHEILNTEYFYYVTYNGSDLPEYVAKEHNMKNCYKSCIVNYNFDHTVREFLFLEPDLSEGLILGLIINPDPVTLSLNIQGVDVATPSMDEYGIYRFQTPIPIIDSSFQIRGLSSSEPKATIIFGHCEFPYPFVGYISTIISGKQKYIKYTYNKFDGIVDE
jgi:hypothetical protein